MYPFTANAPPIQYNGGGQQYQPPQQQNYSGYPQYNAPAPPPSQPYGMVQYPTSNQPYQQPYANPPYQQQQQQQSQNSQMYTGLDAAVYSAATAMLAERGITPQTKTYASGSYSGQSSGHNSNGSSWKNRVEQMNPTVPPNSGPGGPIRTSGGPSGSRGGRGAMSGRGGRGGSFGNSARYQKPKDPANQAMHYCEVCKVSCAGAVSFQAHVIGAKHKKREAQVKQENAAAASQGAPATAAPVAPPRMNSVFQRHQIMCELCGVSTAGKAAYDAHITGKAHQRTLKLHMKLGKPIPENEPTIVQKTVGSSYSASSSAPVHSTGSSICSKVVTGGKTVLITPKMNFVGGTVLTTTVGGLQEVANGQPKTLPAGVVAAAGPAPPTGFSGQGQAVPSGSTYRTPRASQSPQKCSVNPNAAGAEPVGADYVQKLEKEGKVAYYKCTLCECEFSDESGMNSHIRGRRHRISYQKKVDPSIVVELSSAQKKLKEKQRAVSTRTKRPAPGSLRGPPSKRTPRGPPHQWGPPGPYGGMNPYETPRGPYGAPHRAHGRYPSPISHYPTQMQPAHPSGDLAPQTANADADMTGDQTHPGSSRKRQPYNPPNLRLDQQYLLHKHRLIAPEAGDLESLNQTLTDVERALKIVAEKLKFPEESKPVETEVQKPAATDEAAVAPSTDENAAPVVPATPTPQPASTQAQRMLKGSYRFGRMTKNLLTKSHLFGEILLICNRHPSVDNLVLVAETLSTELKTISTVEYVVEANPADCRILVKAVEKTATAASEKAPDTCIVASEETSGDKVQRPFPVWVYMAYGNLRDELFKREAEKLSAANANGEKEKGSIGANENGIVSANTPDSSSTALKESDQSTAQQPPPQAAHQNVIVPADSQSQLQTQQLTTGGSGVGVSDETQTTTATDSQMAAKLSMLSAVDAVGALDLKRSLAVLAQSRRTRWFQEFIAFFPQCRMLMRVLNHVCEQHEDLRLLSGWPIEFLTITVLRLQSAYHGITPFDIPLAEAFWMILSNVTSGVFLPGCTNGFKDPCERGNLDVLGDVAVQERVKLTRAAGELLSRWLTGDYAKVLEVEPLQGDPLYPPPPAPEPVVEPAKDEQQAQPTMEESSVKEEAMDGVEENIPDKVAPSSSAASGTVVAPTAAPTSVIASVGNVSTYFKSLVHGLAVGVKSEQ